MALVLTGAVGRGGPAAGKSVAAVGAHTPREKQSSAGRSKTAAGTSVTALVHPPTPSTNTWPARSRAAIHRLVLAPRRSLPPAPRPAQPHARGGRSGGAYSDGRWRGRPSRHLWPWGRGRLGKSRRRPPPPPQANLAPRPGGGLSSDTRHPLDTPWRGPAGHAPPPRWPQLQGRNGRETQPEDTSAGRSQASPQASKQDPPPPRPTPPPLARSPASRQPCWHPPLPHPSLPNSRLTSAAPTDRQPATPPDENAPPPCARRQATGSGRAHAQLSVVGGWGDEGGPVLRPSLLTSVDERRAAKKGTRQSLSPGVWEGGLGQTRHP